MYAYTPVERSHVVTHNGATYIHWRCFEINNHKRSNGVLPNELLIIRIQILVNANKF